eukprot:Awhi_evm1s9976
MGFNICIYEDEEPDAQKKWDGFSRLVKDKDLKFCATYYQLNEMKNDLIYCRSKLTFPLQPVLSHAPALNKWRSLYENVDPIEVDSFFAQNMYRALLEYRELDMQDMLAAINRIKELQ